VTVLDRNRHREHTQFLADIRDAEAVFDAVGRVDAVIHLAGILGTQETVARPYLAAETNVLGAINVFEACCQQDKPCVSTNVGNYWMLNPYSITKEAASRLAFMYNKERGGRISIVRALNAYGPRQHTAPVHKVIPTFILRAIAGDTIKVYGDGSQRIDMIYVEDVADILLRCLTVEHGIYDRPFEAGTGKAPSVNEIAGMILQLCHSTSKIEHVPMRPGEQDNKLVIGNPASLYPLGKRDFVPLDDGLKRTVAWYRLNGGSGG